MLNTISSIREFICFNQKQTIKYEYLISEQHKELKQFFMKNDKKNSDELKIKYEEFVVQSYKNLFTVFSSNKQYINNIFKSLDKKESPRITIKTIHGEKVLNIYRSTKATNFHSSFIKKNTGFFEILYNNKTSFLCNDIPSAFKNGTYENPRLDSSKKKLFQSTQIEWKDCWLSSDQDNFLEYYSSTLIIPMSIRSDESDLKEQNFYDHFFREIAHNQDSRTVWGFLCFDNPSTNYFTLEKEKEFEEISYIIADILSLYLMYFYNHISGSSTIQEIEETISFSQEL